MEEGDIRCGGIGLIRVNTRNLSSALGECFESDACRCGILIGMVLQDLEQLRIGHPLIHSDGEWQSLVSDGFLRTRRMDDHVHRDRDNTIVIRMTRINDRDLNFSDIFKE